jgi:DnaK suppressor protein
VTPSLDPEEARTLLHEERARLQMIRNALLEQGDGASAEDAVVELPDMGHLAPDGENDAFDPIDDGAILDHLDARLLDVDRALERLETGVFGTCEACGRAIDADRLRARPAARFCVEHTAAGTPA